MGRGLQLELAVEAQQFAFEVAQVDEEVQAMAHQGCMFNRKGAYCLWRPQRTVAVSERKHPTNDNQPAVVEVLSPEHPEVSGVYTRRGSVNGRALYASGPCRLYWGKASNWRLCTEPGDVEENLAVVISVDTIGGPLDVEKWVWWTGHKWLPSRSRVSLECGASDSTPPLSPWFAGSPVTDEEKETPRPCAQKPRFRTPHFGLGLRA